MKKLIVLCAMVLFFGLVGTGTASLTTIGTATYMGNDYNLIYEDNSIYGGLVWLDYTYGDLTDYRDWQTRVDWASGIGGSLTVNLDPSYTTDIDWGTGWRLPRTDESLCNLSESELGWEGPDASGYHDYRHGFNMVNSEMGHLFYESLGNLGFYATDGTYQPGFGLVNTGDFNGLKSNNIYWSGTEFSPDLGVSAWFFSPDTGQQGSTDKITPYVYALAVRPGQVSTVPIPSAIWLLGSAFIGLVGFRRKFGKEVS